MLLEGSNIVSQSDKGINGGVPDRPGSERDDSGTYTSFFFLAFDLLFLGEEDGEEGDDNDDNDGDDGGGGDDNVSRGVGIALGSKSAK